MDLADIQKSSEKNREFLYDDQGSARIDFPLDVVSRPGHRDPCRWLVQSLAPNLQPPSRLLQLPKGLLELSIGRRHHPDETVVTDEVEGDQTPEKEGKRNPDRQNFVLDALRVL